MTQEKKGRKRDDEVTQRYLKFVGEAKAITSTRKGATYGELRELSLRWRLGVSLLTAFKQRWLDAIPNGTTRYRWRETNNEVTLLRVVEDMRLQVARYQKELATRRKAKKQALQRSPVIQDLQRPHQPTLDMLAVAKAQVQRASEGPSDPSQQVLGQLREKLQQAEEQAALQAKAVEAVQQALAREQAKYEALVQQAHDLQRAIDLVSQL